MSSPEPPPSPGTDDLFPNSLWTMIGKAQHGRGSVASEALNQLCGIYWYPIYAYIRHRCGHREEAEDLTQGYFAHLLERGYIDRASPEKGKFRAFLLADVKFYLANEHRREQTLKRGGGIQFLPLKRDWAEERYAHEPVDGITPDQLLDRLWATTLLERVMEALREEYGKKNQHDLFKALKQFIAWNAGDEPYAAAAAKLGRDENYVKVNVHRLRQRYRKLLEAEIAHTVTSPEEIAEEIRHLATSLR